MTIPKRTVSFPNDETGTDWRLVTAEELAALEARKPQVSAGVIARTQGALIGWQNADEFDTEELQEHGDVLRDATRALLSAVEAAPEGEPPRVLRWEGYAEPGPDEGRDVIVRIHCDSIAARRFCGTGKIVHVESAVEASAPTPDFDAMTPDELRAWLDKRGRREGYENRSGRWHVAARERTSGNMIAYVADQPTEPAALLALCQKVAAKEASC